MTYFAVVFTGICASAAAVQLMRTANGAPTSPLALVFKGIGVPAGLAFLAAGLYLLAGRDEIDVTRGRLGTAVRVGPLRWRWTRPVAAVRRLRVVGGGLDAVCTGPRGGEEVLPLAHGLPPPRVAALAEDLARRCDAVRGAGPPLRVVCEAVVIPDTPWRPDPPAGSRARLDRTAEGLSVTLPPAGLLRGGGVQLVGGWSGAGSWRGSRRRP